MSAVAKSRAGRHGSRARFRRDAVPLLVALASLVAIAPGRSLSEQPPADAPAEGARAATGDGEGKVALAEREQRLLSQYRDLEKTFLRLADLLAASDPRRAAVLRGVFEQARDQEVGTRLDTIVDLLQKGQLLKAGTSQASAIEQLRELLTLLEAGDSDRHRANAKEEVKQFLARVTKLIAKQRDIEGATEAGTAGEKLAERQDVLASETGDLSRDLGGFAKRMEVRDPGGETMPSETAKDGGSDGEGDDGEGGPNKKRADPVEPGNNGPGAKEPGDEGMPKGEGDGPPEGQPRRDAQAGEGDGSAETTPGGDEPGDASSPPSPGGDQPGQPGAGEPGKPGDEGKPEESAGDDESSRALRTQKRLDAATERMRRAEDRLQNAKRKDARQDQEKAIEELETARAELEEILRQLREQEVERLLVQLEARLRGMLRAEKAVLAGIEKLSAEPADGRDRERQLESARLGRDQAAVGTDALKALALVRDDGSAVAIPEALEQVGDDAAQAASRLGRGDTSATTRGLVQDIVSNLEELVAALEKAQRSKTEQQKGQAGGRPAEPGEQPLVDKLSELKMIRSLQMRVNTRTRRFAQVLGDGAEQAEEPALLDAVRRLAERQQKIERAAHDIVSGLTE